MNIKYIFFDVAETILCKPLLLNKIQAILFSEHYDIPINELRKIHRLLMNRSEISNITTKSFYDKFNSELLFALGVIPNNRILDLIYNECKDLPWDKFEDTEYLSNNKTPMGIISNWDLSLEKLLNEKFDIKFERIICSEKVGVRKPNLEIFQIAIKDLCVEPNNILYVGDSIELDILPSCNLGFQAILIDRYEDFPYFKGERISSLFELKNY